MEKSRILLWGLLVWFALLQAVAPLIHGHLGKDNAQDGVGIHVHTLVTNAFKTEQQTATNKPQLMVELPTQHAYSIGIEDGLLKKRDLTPVLVFFIALLVIYARLICHALIRLPRLFLPPNLLFYQHPLNRAPPAL